MPVSATSSSVNRPAFLPYQHPENHPATRNRYAGPDWQENGPRVFRLSSLTCDSLEKIVGTTTIVQASSGMPVTVSIRGSNRGGKKCVTSQFNTLKARSLAGISARKRRNDEKWPAGAVAVHQGGQGAGQQSETCRKRACQDIRRRRMAQKNRRTAFRQTRVVSKVGPSNWANPASTR